MHSALELAVFEIHKIVGSCKKMRDLQWEGLNEETKSIVGKHEGVSSFCYELPESSFGALIEYKHKCHQLKGRIFRVSIPSMYIIVKRFKAEQKRIAAQSIEGVLVIDKKIDLYRQKIEKLEKERKVLIGLNYSRDYHIEADIDTNGLRLEQLGLSVRSFNALYRAGYKNVDELVNIIKEGQSDPFAFDKLLCIPGFGQKSLTETVYTINVILDRDYTHPYEDT